LATIAAGAGIAASGASIANSFGLIGGGSDQTGPAPGPISATGTTLDELLGISFRGVHGHGSDAGQPFAIQDLANSVVPTLFDSTRDFASNPLPLSPEEQAARTLVQSLAPGLIGSGLEGLLGNQGFANEAAETGFFNDPTSSLQADLTRLKDDFANQQEMLGQFGSSALTGSPSKQIAADSLRRFEENRTALRDAAQEAASNRRISGIGLANTSNILPSAFVTSQSADLANFGKSFRTEEESLRRRPLDIFKELSGMEQGPYFSGGFNTQDNTSGLLASLAENIPVISSGLQDIFGGNQAEVDSIPFPDVVRGFSSGFAPDFGD